MRKKRGILLVVLAMLLATAGVVWAHWTATLHVEGHVNTGGVNMGWYDAFTNDDGDLSNDPTGTDDGGPYDGMWDNWGEGSSADPSDPWGEGRYDKDVAGCWAWSDGQNLWFEIQNGYPSYYCWMGAKLVNDGTVPVKATTLNVQPGFYHCEYYIPGAGPFGLHGDGTGFEWLENWGDENPGDEFNPDLGDIAVHYDGDVRYADLGPPGPDPDDPEVIEECYWDDQGLAFMPGEYEGNFAIGHYDGQFVPELTGDIALGVRCGTQIDPGDGDAVWTGGWVHVEQEAWQYYDYHWSLDQSFVNWNEFSYCLCTHGVPAADADGNIIGMVNHDLPDQDCLELP